MTRDEAQRAVQSFFEAHGQTGSPGLNARGLGKANLDADILTFEFIEAQGALRCGVLVYRFREKPRPEILQALRDEDRAEPAPGRLEYDAEARSLLATRRYEAPPENLPTDLEELRETARRWREEGIPRAAERAPKRDLT